MYFAFHNEEIFKAKARSTDQVEMWGGSFSYLNNNTYIFDINNQLNIRIHASNANIANIFFTDGNDNVIPIPATRSVLFDLTNQVVRPAFGFLYQIIWKNDYELILWNLKVFALKHQRQQAVLKGTLGFHYRII